MRNDFESNYLAHHGILGQRWGKKNGPPYPLGAEDHSAREKKAGYKKSLGGGRNEELYGKSEKTSDSSKEKKKEKFHLSDNQKKVLKIGAAVAATALVAYGGYKLVSNPKVRNLIAKGMRGSKATRMANIEKAIQNSGPEIVKRHSGSSGNKLNVLSKDSKLYNVLEGCNSSRRMDNCKELSLENACKALGVNVDLHSSNPQAGRNIGQLCEELGIGSNLKSMTAQSSNPEEIKAQVKRYLLKRNSEGSSGIIGVGYSEEAQKRIAKEIADNFAKHGLEAPEVTIEGHVFNWVIENGDVTFACGQPGIPTDKSDIFADIDIGKDINLMTVTKEIAETIKKNS